MASIFDALLTPDTEAAAPERNAALVAALKRQQQLGIVGQLMGSGPTMRVGQHLQQGAQQSFGEALQQQAQARQAAAQAAAQKQAQTNWQAHYDEQKRQFGEQQQRLKEQGEQSKWGVVADPVTGGFLRYNSRTGETQPVGPRGTVPTGATAPTSASDLPVFNIDRVGKPTDQARNQLLSIRQQRGAIEGAVAAAQGNPQAFGVKQGLAEQFGGELGAAVSQWARNPQDAAARAFVLNNVSAIINERAGAAQSAQELARLRGFLPSDTDNVPKITGKFNAFLDYLDEKEAATRGYSKQELGLASRVKPATAVGAGAQGGVAPAQLPGGETGQTAADKYLQQVIGQQGATGRF